MKSLIILLNVIFLIVGIILWVLNMIDKTKMHTYYAVTYVMFVFGTIANLGYIYTTN